MDPICIYVGIFASREGWCLGCTILPNHQTLSSLVALFDTADVDYRRGQSFAMSSNDGSYGLCKQATAISHESVLEVSFASARCCENGG